MKIFSFPLYTKYFSISIQLSFFSLYPDDFSEEGNQKKIEGGRKKYFFAIICTRDVQEKL
jgi:hypothetical protein